jgi:hypothetical protein
MCIVFLLAVHFSTHAEMSCDLLDNENYKSDIYIYPAGSLYEATGTGRLFFHSAPDDRCIQKNIFIIPGDQVNAYTEYSDFVSVMYIDSHGKDTEGWVKRDRLQEVKAREE